MSKQELTNEEFQAVVANRCAMHFKDIAKALVEVLTDFPGAKETAYFLNISGDALALYGLAKGLPEPREMPNDLSNISIN